MKSILHQLNLGKINSGMDLYATVKRDNVPLFRMKCDSFLDQFMRSVYQNFSHGYIDGYWYGRGHQYRELEDNGGWTVQVVNNGQDVRVGRTSGSSWITEGNVAVVGGVQGITGVNGTWKTAELDPETPYPFRMVNRAYIIIENLGPEVTGEWIPGTGVIYTGNLGIFHHDNNGYTVPKNWGAVVGHSDKAVHSRDLALGNIWSYGNLMGNISISSQITDQESSKFTISRPFTNNSGEQVALREIGIMSYSQNQWMLLARDVLASAVQLAQGSTLSIDYEVVSNIQNFTQDTDTGGTNGGWTRRFITLMRLFASNHSSAEYYGAMAMGGNGSALALNQYQNNANAEGWRYGVRLGTNNKYVSMTDESLNPDDDNVNGIENGFGDNQLVHSGTHFGEFQTGDDYAQFTVERYFENKGAVPIEVKEIGLFGNGSTSTTMTPSLFARKALNANDQFTIQPGQTVKVGFLCKAFI